MKRGATPPQPMSPWPVSPAGLGTVAPDAWHALFEQVDPYTDDWRAALRARAAVLASSEWEKLRALYPAAAPAHVVARNAWVGIERSKRDREARRPALALTLQLAVPGEPRVDEVCSALRAVDTSPAAREAWHWVDVVLGTAEIRSTQTGIGGVAGEIALRYALALAHRCGMRQASELFDLLALHPGAPRREMGAAVREFLAHGTVSPLPVGELESLPLRLQVLLAERAWLRPPLLGVALDAPLPVLEESRAQWRQLRALRELIRPLCRHLQRRELSAANRLASRLMAQPWTPEAMTGLEGTVHEALVSPAINRRTSEIDWPSKHRPLAESLLQLAPAHPTAALFALTPKQIAACAAANPGFRVREHLSDRDFRLLREAWAEREQAALLKAGRFELLPERHSVHSRAEVQALLEHADDPRASDMLLFALRTGHAPQLLRALDDAPALRRVLGRAARHDDAVVGVLVQRLGEPLVDELLPAQVLARGKRLVNAIGYWHTQPAGARKKRAMARLIEVITALDLAKSAAPLGQFMDMAPGAARTIAKRLGADELARRLPLLESTHWAFAEGTDAPVLAAGIAAGFAPGDPLASWTAVCRQPRLIPLLERLRLPSPTTTSPGPLLGLNLLLDHSPAKITQLRSALGQALFASGARDVLPLLPPHAPSTALLDLAANAPGIDLMPLVQAFGALRFDAPPGCKLDHCYHTYPLPKKAGGNRTITAPPTWLRSVQRQIYTQLILPCGSHEAAHGFVPKRSIVSNAHPHVGHAVVVNCDIQNCFPSVRRPLVLAALRRDLGARLRDGTLLYLADLCCYHGALPVGAPSSPALLNRVLLRTDVYLSAQAARRGAVYTRYADDLTFSGDDRAVGLLRIAASSLARIDLALDDKKTNIYRGGRRQMVTGLVVNQRVSVPRRLRRRLRAAVHAIEQGRTPTWHGEPVSAALVRGWLAFARHVNEEEAQRLLDRLAALAPA